MTTPNTLLQEISNKLDKLPERLAAALGRQGAARASARKKRGPALGRERHKGRQQFTKGMYNLANAGVPGARQIANILQGIEHFQRAFEHFGAMGKVAEPRQESPEVPKTPKPPKVTPPRLPKTRLPPKDAMPKPKRQTRVVGRPPVEPIKEKSAPEGERGRRAGPTMIAPESKKAKWGQTIADAKVGAARAGSSTSPMQATPDIAGSGQQSLLASMNDLAQAVKDLTDLLKSPHGSHAPVEAAGETVKKNGSNARHSADESSLARSLMRDWAVRLILG